MDLLTAAAEYAPMLKMLPAGPLAKVAKRLATSADNARARFTATFSDHINATKRKCAYVRTLTDPNTPVALEDIYVNLYVMNGRTSIRDEDLLNATSEFSKVLITGTGGAGKSMLMRRNYPPPLRREQIADSYGEWIDPILSA